MTVVDIAIVEIAGQRMGSCFKVSGNGEIALVKLSEPWRQA